MLFFDGHCNLCNRSVQWVLQRDRKGIFRFASLQSATARRLLPPAGIDPRQLSSLVLLHDGRAWTHSEGALRTARLLGGGYRWSGQLGLIIPRPLRDAVYRFIARHRYRWFGRTDNCWLPRPEWKSRFLD